MSASSRLGAHVRSNAVGYLALFLFALSGTAVATHGVPNSISSEDIIDGEVRSVDVQNNGIRTGDIRDDSRSGGGLTAADLRPASVGSSELAPDAVGSSAVADDSLLGSDFGFETIGSADLTDLSVIRDKIATGAVSGTKISDFSVLNVDLGSAQVDNRVLGSGAVNSRVVQDGTLTSADIDEAGVSGLDRCPSSTLRLGPICAGSPNSHKTWGTAAGFCADLGLRLPTVGEARTVAGEHDLPNVGETEFFWTDGRFVEGGAQRAYALTDASTIDDFPISQTFETVCVTTPLN